MTPIGNWQSEIGNSRMSEPEISHRCLSCGASHRGHALYCPQCGAPLDQSRENPPAKEADGRSASKVEVKAGANVEVNKSDVSQAGVKKAAAVEASPPQRRRSDRSDDKSSAPAKPPGNPAQASNGKSGKKPLAGDGREGGRAAGSKGDKARRNIQRATAAARDAVGDNVRPKVEKIRHASSVVIEEASDDPSLRFILVAGLLFVVFVVLLFISKII